MYSFILITHLSLFLLLKTKQTIEKNKHVNDRSRLFATQCACPRTPRRCDWLNPSIELLHRLQAQAISCLSFRITCAFFNSILPSLVLTVSRLQSNFISWKLRKANILQNNIDRYNDLKVMIQCTEGVSVVLGSKRMSAFKMCSELSDEDYARNVMLDGKRIRTPNYCNDSY